MRRPPALARDSERGAALLMALLVLVLVASAGLLASLAHALDRRSHRDDLVRLRLSALTDSAVAEALAALERDPWAPGFAPHPFGGGEIGSAIEPASASVRRVEVRARYAGRERRATAWVEVDGGVRVVAWRPEGITPAAP
jgi:hypothetical protein